MPGYNVVYPDRAINVGGVQIPAQVFAAAAVKANEYLRTINRIFQEKHINFFEALGVTNISATVGEIYARFLCKEMPELLVSNPHPDGRPDVLCLSTDEAKLYYKGCFTNSGGKEVPIKSMFTPFLYGGIEIKCTIGSSFSSSHKAFLRAHYGVESFPIGVQRVDFLKNVNWVAHHVQNVDLLGLYYDYFPEFDSAPQIVAGFFGSLTSDSWNPVSHGNPNKKTTSMTSIKGDAQKQMKKNCLFKLDNRKHIDKLNEIGVEM